MLTILIFGILGILIILYYLYAELKFGKEIGERVFCLIVILFGFIIGCSIGFIIALVLPAKLEYKKVSTYKIVCLKDGTRTKGDFFLGCGNIKGQMNYIFYYEENGAYKFKRIDCGEALIYYTNLTPKIEHFAEYPTNDWINKFAINSFKEYYNIYVPEGTIKTDFILDAE